MEDNYRKKMLLGQDGNALVQLVVINAVLFVILKFIYVVYVLQSLNPVAYENNVLSWFVLPANLDRLSSRPWTVLTYMFSDTSVFRFIGNMFWLWGFLAISCRPDGQSQAGPHLSLWRCGRSGFFVLSYVVFPGCVLTAPLPSWQAPMPPSIAVAVATTVTAPDYRIFPMINGGIPLWILTVIYLLINFSSITHGDSGAYIANFAGAGMGFLFIYRLRRGHDGSVWLNNFFDWCNDLFNPDRKKKGRLPKDEFYYKVSGTQPFKKIPNVTQQRIDEILDKINQQGYTLPHR